MITECNAVDNQMHPIFTVKSNEKGLREQAVIGLCRCIRTPLAIYFTLQRYIIFSYEPNFFAEIFVRPLTFNYLP